MSHDKEKIAVFGQGIIGSRCAARLSEADYDVITWNRTPKPDTIHPAATPAEAAEDAGVLLFYLKDGIALREVVEVMRAQLRPDHVLINHSTVDLDTTHWLAKLCEEVGCGFLDSPFTGSKVAADQGQLVYYVGGDPVLIERMSTIMEVTSKEVHHFGKVGDATIIKIVTNLISAATVQALAEAQAITTRLGLPASLLTEAVASNACGSPLAAMKLKSMAEGDFETHFSLENMRKDSELAKQLASLSKTRTPATDTTYECLERLCQAGHGDLDYGALAKAFDR